MGETTIYVSRYVMHSRSGLNSRSHALEHAGALLRIEKHGVAGFACLHPWEELGDPSLDQLLDDLQQGRTSRMLKCAKECANADREAREKGVSLFEGLTVPHSHATVVGGVERVALAVEQGFDTVKMKLGRDVAADIECVQEVHEAFPKLRLRFDFNGILGAGQCLHFAQELDKDIRQQIDFLEDPCPHDLQIWETLRSKYALKTAVDRGVHKVKGSYDFVIIKPAINHLSKIADDAMRNGKKAVVTSYMDHPIGQSYAAYCAAKLEQDFIGLIDPRCGLMTHELYEPTAFTEQLGTQSPQWKIPAGTGLGFDDQLETLEWAKL